MTVAEVAVAEMAVAETAFCMVSPVRMALLQRMSSMDRVVMVNALFISVLFFCIWGIGRN